NQRDCYRAATRNGAVSPKQLSTRDRGTGLRPAAPCYPKTMSPPAPALRAEKLTKIYRSGDADLVIFDSLDLQVHRGEMLALVGESGAGKSTLLHLLGGLDRPTSGTIYYGSI